MTQLDEMPELCGEATFLLRTVDSIFSKSSAGWADVKAYFDLLGISCKLQREELVSSIDVIINSEEYHNANS